MIMKNYEITTEIKGTEKFLVIKGIRVDEINSYHLKMAELNSIYGILPIKSQNIDGNVVLNYPLGNNFQLLWLINQNSIGSAEMKMVYTRLVETIMGMKEYFLEASNFLYNLEYVYIDSRLNPYLVYIPAAERDDADINRTWKDFFLNLLSYASAGKEEAFYDKLMRLLIQPAFNLNTFYDYLKDEVSIDIQPAFRNAEPAYQADSVSKAVQSDTVPQPTPVVVVKEETQHKKGLFGFGKSNADNSDKTSAMVAESVLPHQGFAIPGVDNGEMTIPQPAPAPTEHTEEKGKKKGLFGFGFKKSDAAPAVSVVEEKSVQTPASNDKAVSGMPMPSVKDEYVSSKNEYAQTDKENSGWRNTVFIKPPVVEEARQTVMLSNSRQPHLMHGEAYIPISQFPFTIGRASTDYIINNPTVSRSHATIFKQGDKVYIRHDATSNNTYVNGRMLQVNEVAELTDGAQLILSDEKMIYHG